jgi:hypothetical protein
VKGVNYFVLQATVRVCEERKPLSAAAEAIRTINKNKSTTQLLESCATGLFLVTQIRFSINMSQLWEKKAVSAARWHFLNVPGS